MSKRFLFLAICLLLACFAMSANAGFIAVDEDFEGASAFVDQNYWNQPPPPANSAGATITVTAAQINAHMGTAIRCSLQTTPANAAYFLPKPDMTNGGTVVSTRHFAGAKALQLASGQSIKPTNKGTANYANRQTRLLQFALSASTETLPAVGTRVGYLKDDWTITTGTVTTTSTDVVEAGLYLNFVVGNGAAAGSKAIDIVCSNTGQTLGSITGGIGSWALISIIQNSAMTAAAPNTLTGWRAKDTLVTPAVFKGPVPTDQVSSTATVGMLPGMHVFVQTSRNNPTPAVDNLIPRAAIGTITGPGITDGTWGNDNATSSAKPLNSAEINWQIGAENGATLFLDEIYWDRGYHDGVVGNAGYDQECAGRMADFNAMPNEPIPADVAAVNTWDLY